MRALVYLAVAACSFTHGAPATGNGSDAGSNSPRDAPIRDSSLLAPDAFEYRDAPTGDLCMASSNACSSAGGSCVAGTCVIPISSMSGATCPDAMPCRINCMTMNACKNDTVSCGNATSCIVDCQMMNSCQGDVIDCRGAGCTFYCRANNTCMNDNIGCTSETCTFDCCASNQCNNNSGDMPTYNLLGMCPP
jgi:hypothetical protein